MLSQGVADLQQWAPIGVDVPYTSLLCVHDHISIAGYLVIARQDRLPLQLAAELYKLALCKRRRAANANQGVSVNGRTLLGVGVWHAKVRGVMPLRHFPKTVLRKGGLHGPPSCLALARWAGWSVVQVGHHVRC